MSLPSVPALINVLGTVQDLYSFLSNDLPSILNTLGQGNLRSAQGALNNIDLSSNPERELTIAITHLQNAYEKFDAIGNGDKSLVTHAKTALLLGLGSGTSGAEARRIAFWNAYSCSLLIAMCYKYLGEASLVNKYTNQAADALNEHLNEYSQQQGWASRAINRSDTKKYKKNKRDEFREISFKLSSPMPRRF